MVSDCARVSVAFFCFLLIWPLRLSGRSQSSSKDNCTQLEVRDDLQQALLNASLVQPSTAGCVQINIAPGNYTISRAINVSRDMILQGTGEGVFVHFWVTQYQTGQSLYVLQFTSSNFAVLKDIYFVNSSGIIGFENVSEVVINNCTFSNFSEGAVDIYNCGFPTITNCTFQNNGPVSAIKKQPYRGHAGGLSIGLSFKQSIGYDPVIQVLHCKFIKNSAVVGKNVFQSSSNALQNLAFTGRGGGASILVNASNPVYMYVENCIFTQNDASSSGGGLFLLLDGSSNDTFVVNRTVFTQNRGFLVGSGALQLAFRDSGTSPRLHSVLVHNSEFTENKGHVGGAIYFRTTSFAIHNEEVLDYTYIKNCTFVNNEAVDFGGAVAVTSFITLSERGNTRPLDMEDCIFKGNKVTNSIGGTLGIAYLSINMLGTNIFSENSGSTISLQGSIMTITGGGSLIFINNTNTGRIGGALYLTSLAQIILNDDNHIIFDGNSGSYGAAIVVDGYIPFAVQYTPNNSVCFVRHLDAYPVEWASHNISFMFANNAASIGSSVYMTDIFSCFSSNGYAGAQLFGLDFANYQRNVNFDHQQDVYDPRWNVQTPPISITVQNNSFITSAYAGGMLKVYVSIVGELGNPVSAILRLSDDDDDETSLEEFPPNLVLYNDLYDQAFSTEFQTLAKLSGKHRIRITPIQSYTSYRGVFYISQQPCPFGFVLTPQSSGFQSCQCNPLNPNIGNCSGTTVQFIVENGPLWGNASKYLNGYGDTMVTYSCPMGYCHCEIAEQAVGVMCLYSVDTADVNSQCDCQRTGVLCGDCSEGLGVSALLNQCVTCDNASGLLIALLIIFDVIAITLIIMAGIRVQSWVQPCLFYLQILPYLTEHFPATFSSVHHYLYYMTSGLSFYFVYDFCLYSEMSPLVSYFIRYIPLFIAIIVFPIILVIRQRKLLHTIPWHGLWWIVVLMYTHIVHTSMSILNCPRLPGRDGNTTNIWYINGNIECFTGSHLALAVMAVIILTLCVAVIPITAGMKLIPKWAHGYFQNISPSITANYRVEVEWFGALDLTRRVIAVLFILLFPLNEHPFIFLLSLILSVYGYIQPYKQMRSNVLEVVLAVNVMVMLLLKNTDQLIDLQVLPDYVPGANNTGACVDYEDILGITPFVTILVPFYYALPVILLSGTAIWCSMALYIKLKKCHGLRRKVDVDTGQYGSVRMSTSEASAELMAF